MWFQSTLEAYRKCIYEGNRSHTHTLQSRLLTGVRSRHLGLQLLKLFDQQGDVLQQVFVLQQQLVDPGLGLQSGRGLRAQLVPQEVDLRETKGSGESDGNV